MKGVILYDECIFKDEEITENDLYFMCYIIERISRTLHRRNRDVVNAIGYDELAKKLVLQVCSTVKIL